ncbi:acylphosphatase [Lutimonas halocynthiae]|uniref:acylphosphatase n=1 Tax=Lutimonas halocynthiae TaxID=1446477 RepID=UPI0025B2C832|nr:acylphosphatase [Lutimonas halocynthiae]MDN3643736.1 acylphosphatase [Lutimonas halocynthiae]
MIKNYQIQVVGKVQGVWFRKYTFEEAVKLNIVGFVRNEQNGSVYVEAEGIESDLNQLLRFLEKGSPMSKVESVNYELAPVRHYTEFKISR